VKFGPMLDYAMGRMGAESFATGHYARLWRTGSNSTATHGAYGAEHAVQRENSYCGAQLARAKDYSKDQSYFLAAVRPCCELLKSHYQYSLHICQVGPTRWDNVMFPLGTWTKTRVRARAEELGLRVAAKKSSTGLCFVGKRRFGDFISQYLPDQPGPIRCASTQRVRFLVLLPCLLLSRCTDADHSAAADTGQASRFVAVHGWSGGEVEWRGKQTLRGWQRRPRPNGGVELKSLARSTG
jgi:hypothetical protein